MGVSIYRFSGVADPNLLSVWRNFVEIDRLYPGGGGSVGGEI